MTKHRKRSRSQKGGGFFDKIFGSSDPYAPPPNPYAPEPPSLWQQLTGSKPKNYQTPYPQKEEPGILDFLTGSSSPTGSTMPMNNFQPPMNNFQPAYPMNNFQPPMLSQPPMNNFQPPMLNQPSFIGPRRPNLQSQAQNSSYGSGFVNGGKLKKQTMNKNKTMKGGKGGLGLTYYATPVSGLNVAEPTSWQYYANGTNQYTVKGGSKRRHSCKSRKSCKICKTRKQRK
jgi:hypothetical protein